MKITKNISVAVSKSAARITMQGPWGEAWDHWFYIGRAMEPDFPNMRAWQFHFLWFNLSVWKENCSPLVHELHTAARET